MEQNKIIMGMAMIVSIFITFTVLVTIVPEILNATNEMYNEQADEIYEPFVEEETEVYVYHVQNHTSVKANVSELSEKYNLDVGELLKI